MGARRKGKKRAASMRRRATVAEQEICRIAGGAPVAGTAERDELLREMRKAVRGSFGALYNGNELASAAAPLSETDKRDFDVLEKEVTDMIDHVAERTRDGVPRDDPVLRKYVEDRIMLAASDIVGSDAISLIRSRYFGGEDRLWEQHLSALFALIGKRLAASIIDGNDVLHRLASARDGRLLHEAILQVIEAAIAFAARMLGVSVRISKDLIELFSAGIDGRKKEAAECIRVVVRDAVAGALPEILLPALADAKSMDDLQAQLRRVDPALIDALCQEVLDRLLCGLQQTLQETAGGGTA